MAGTVVEDADWRFYLSVRDELVATSRGKYVLIRNRAVIGVFPTAIAAFEEGRRRFGAGGSLIVHIGKEAWSPAPGASARRLGRSGKRTLVDNPIREVDLPPPA